MFDNEKGRELGGKGGGEEVEVKGAAGLGELSWRNVGRIRGKKNQVEKRVVFPSQSPSSAQPSDLY